MVHCVAVDCVNNTRGGNKNISFYRLPRDNSLKKIWMQKIKRENLPNQENIRLCHFEDSCFERDLKIDIHVLLNNQLRSLFFENITNTYCNSFLKI